MCLLLTPCVPLFYFFFLMIRQPPRSTLFPYTTLSDLAAHSGMPSAGNASEASEQRRGPAGEPGRSEEHTSELQSHSDLVCRLLLEKKKKKNEIPARSISASLNPNYLPAEYPLSKRDSD